ncbi:hypothetical protein DFH09DRAFT_378989 [Mycena vulgaris]|nr:hypothetical protein DFH09DRAFT_378989 [Mycena vulgaris]
MAIQSKLAHPSARQAPRSTSRAVAAAAAAATRPRDDDVDKENAQPGTLSRRTVLKKRRIEDEAEYENEDEDDHQGGSASEDNDDEEDGHPGDGDDDFDEDGNAHVGSRAAHSSDDEEENPARVGRTRRLSEKEAQRLADKKEAAARKVAKTVKAAKKQRRLEMGDEPVPLADTVFTSRDVELTKKAKTLQQRNSRVPATQARLPALARGRTHEPSQDLRRIISKHQEAGSSRGSRHDEMFDTPRRDLASSSIGDWRHSAVTPGPVESDEEPRPRSINGHVFPAHVRLDLHAGASASHAEPSDVDDHPRDSRPRRPRPQQRRRRSESRSPSHSPVAGDKRPRSPGHEDDIRATQAQKINDHQGRPRAKDYDDTTQELIGITNTWYRCLLATRDAYPDVVRETELVNLAWSKACEELKVSMRITPDIAKLITRRGAQMRGELKTKVRGLVELVFGFESGQNKKNIRKNRQLAEDLKEGMGYSYREFPSVATKRKGMYKAKIIQKSTNVMWFNNRRDEGATHPELFGPVFPKPAFALVLSAIECSIDEWATGVKSDVPFTAADYRGVYLEHLKCLEEFEKHTAPRGILDNILTRMHNIGRFHSGAQPIAPVKTASLSKAVLDAALKEYDEDDNTETDGEDGEHSTA